LLHEGTLRPENFFAPQPLERSRILAVHEESYWNRLNELALEPADIRRIGFPLTRELVTREITIANGTVQCSLFALQNGVAMNIAGGTHHAFTYKGEGFCLLNDIAIAARYLLDEGLVKQILVVDLDVHQGNGTAQIFKYESRVFTFSMHGQNNYPLHKEQSDLDIGLADFTNDDFYLNTLRINLDLLMDQVRPDFIFFLSGVDILKTDKLGKLSVSREGCKERDRIVLQAAKQSGIPLVASMGGGYSTDFRDIIEAHANTFRLAQEIFF
jgi:acetoin utilization deacetylase AcuC-like enzyme